MIKMTQSFEKWCAKFYPKKLVPLMFGHIEELTEQMWNEYLDWVQTDEGKEYLEGGSKWKGEQNDTLHDDNSRQV